MEDSLALVETSFLDGMGQLADYWGYNKVVGWIYGLLYLQDGSLSLETIAGELQVSKGNISINIREAERLGMVKKVWKKGDRKDYYEAEPNLWQIIRRITRERQKKEFDFAMETVSIGLAGFERVEGDSKQVRFARKRLNQMSAFLKSANVIINGLLSLETLRGAAVQACPVRSRLPRRKGD